MTLLQSLYAWYHRFFSRPAPAAAKCPIVELPAELILCITGHLAAHDKFLLSHTCRAMQRLASCDWNEYLRSRSPTERNDFLLGLAYSTPNHWACESCGRLHAIDWCDFPLWRTSPSCVQPTDSGARTWARYNLEHHHIQLALKLSRRGANRSHLKRLLATHYNVMACSGVTFSYYAYPKIVEGHFLLFERILVGDGHRRVSYPRPQQSLIAICPHLTVVNNPVCYRWLIEGLRLTTELDQSMALAVCNSGKEIHGHCKWCPTDYSVIFSRKNGQLVFNAWHDFGAYGSISSPHWSSQVWRQGGGHDQRSTQFDRVPGECRAAYINASSGEGWKTLPV